MKRLLGICTLLGFFLLASSKVAAQGAASAKTYTRTIYLVRHGHYDSRPNAGPDGPGISTLGIAQARLVAARLRGLPVTFSSLTASTMTRARETAAVINQSLAGLNLQLNPLLRECTPRSWNPAVLKEEKPEDMAAAEVQLNAAFAHYFIPAKDRDEHDIIVCHGNVTRYFVTKALGVDTQAWLNMSVAHCSLTIIQVKADGTFRITAVGDSGHISSNLLSGTTSAPTPQLVAP